MSNGKFRVKNFFGQFILLFSFSECRQTFWKPLETSLRKGCQKCLVGTQRKVLEKNRTFGKTIFDKKLQISSGNLSADLRTAFFVSTGKYWGKSCSPQSYIRIIPTLDSEQKTLGRFFKPVLELYRATFPTKYCFLEETIF